MRLLTASEAKIWMNDNAQSGEVQKHSVDYLLPQDSGWKTTIARAMAEFFDGAEEVLVDLDNWDVWPSSCSMPLFNAFRGCSGDSRSIDEAPAQLFASGESEGIESLLALVLYFVWDAVVVDKSGTTAFSISHDEWLRVSSTDHESLEQIARHFEFLRLVKRQS